jgi:hypothetical protein
MTVAVEPAPVSLASLLALRERVQHRLDEATPYGPDWAAASDYVDEIDEEIAARIARRDEPA